MRLKELRHTFISPFLAVRSWWELIRFLLREFVGASYELLFDNVFLYLRVEYPWRLFRKFQKIAEMQDSLIIFLHSE